MTFYFTPHEGAPVNWTKDELQLKLKELAKAEKKVWLHHEVKKEKPDSPEKDKKISQQFDSLKSFGEIDPSKTRLILEQLQKQIADYGDKALVKVYIKAVKNFNSFDSNHKIKLNIKLVTSSGTTNKAPKLDLPGNLKEALKVKKNLSKGSNPDDLLLNAVMNVQPEIAEWLIRKGASLNKIKNIKNLSPEQKELADWLNKNAQAPPISPKTLEAYAIGLGLGYKSANLMALQTQTNHINQSLQTAEVKVPPFLPIGDYLMTHHLMKAMPNLQKNWKEFLNSFDPSKKKEFLTAGPTKSPLKISDQAREILAGIHKQIEDHFNQNPYFTLQIEEWLKKEKPEFLIVRSTGKEDSDTSSNAGGNESIPFVRPNAKEISDAIGKVLASYFSEKSIAQRLTAGDTSLFLEEKPFLPVLLQVMVGENLGGKDTPNEEIPRSGVLFTRQQDKASGVTFIQTGLGNNEGIVSSRVAVDSYFVGSDKRIHAVVRNKTTRFVSVEDDRIPGKYTAEPIRNADQALIRNKALPEKIILDLKTVADEISTNYGDPKNEKAMDVEYTIKLKDKDSKKPVIYLLQARPLLENQGPAIKEKSYLDLKSLEKIKSSQKVNAQTILDGNAYVRKIAGQENILFVDDLPKALEHFLKAPDPQKIQAIVIKKMGASTSHEAVTLKPKGVPVFVVEDPQELEKLKNMASQANDVKPLLCDPQRGVFAATTEINKPFETIRKGMISYPIPLEFSVPVTGLLSTPQAEITQKNLKQGLDKLNENYSALIDKLRNGKNLLILSTAQRPEGYSTRGLLETIATSDATQAKLALATLLNLLHKNLLKSMKGAEEFRAGINLPMFQIFEAVVDQAINEIIPAIDQFPPESLNRLYPLKFLDALIFQQPNLNVIGGFSYGVVLRTDLFEKDALNKAKASGITFNGANAYQQLQLLKFGSAAFNPACENNWQIFTRQLMDLGDTQLIQDCIDLVNKAQSLNLGPVWLNVIFNKAWQSNKYSEYRAVETLNDLKSWQRTSDTVLDWVKEKSDELSIIEQQMDQWAHPEFVAKNMGKLKETFLTALGFNPDLEATSLYRKYADANDYGKLSILHLMRRAIGSFDQCLKTLKGSTEYKNEKQKAKDFAELLEGYYAMMKGSLSMISKGDEEEMMQPNMGKMLTFDKYLTGIENGAEYQWGFNHVYTSIGFKELLQDAHAQLLDPDIQFSARPEFSVDSFVVGSKADLNFSSHWPSTLEEYFTTFHQNMEKVIKFLNIKSGLNANILLDQASDLTKYIESIYLQNISTVNAVGSKIEVGFQIPIRQHSASLVIKYDAKAPDNGLDLLIQIYGDEEHNRWEQAAVWGALLGNTPELSLSGNRPPKYDYNIPPEQGNGVEFSLHFPRGYQDYKNMLRRLNFLTHTLTKEDIGGREGLKSAIESMVSWNEINERFFGDCFYLNTLLMDKFSQKKQHSRVAVIAKNSLLGLSRQGLKDYTRYASSTELKDYLGKPNYSYVPENKIGQPSLKLMAALHLIKSFENDPKAVKPIIEGLIQDPGMKKFPEIAAALKQAIQNFEKPKNEQEPVELNEETKLNDYNLYKEKIQDNDFLPALGLFSKYKDKDWLNLLFDKTDKVVNDFNNYSGLWKSLNTLLDITEKLYELGIVEQASNKILNRLDYNRFRTEDKNRLVAIKQKGKTAADKAKEEQKKNDLVLFQEALSNRNFALLFQIAKKYNETKFTIPLSMTLTAAINEFNVYDPPNKLTLNKLLDGAETLYQMGYGHEADLRIFNQLNRQKLGYEDQNRIAMIKKIKN